ncbi:MAG: hypothetical protein O2923_01445 [Verrucomicrobia bacterium]|nr:hypothetical protein [Verrucomicrobiota bacterium]
MGAQRQLGEFLVERGYLTEDQLAEAVGVQKRPNETRRLGEILVSRGYVTSSQIQIALARQHDPSD